MTELEQVVGRICAQPRVAGDAVRVAIAGELLAAVAATIRFLTLNRRTWVSGRYTEVERDMLRGVAERIESATARDLIASCPLCGCHTCETGCALESVREVAQAPSGLADGTPTTEAERQ